jgi:hypothetical protein
VLVDGHICQHRSSFTVAHGEGRGTRGRRAEVVGIGVYGNGSSLCTQRNWDDGCWCCESRYLPIWVSFSGVRACLLTYVNGHILTLLTWRSLSAGI